MKHYILFCEIMLFFTLGFSQSNMSNEVYLALHDPELSYDGQFEKSKEIMEKYSYQFAGEKISVCKKQLLPHSLQYIKTPELKLQNLAEIYLILSDNYLYIENVQKSLACIDTLLFYAENIEELYVQAYYFRKYAERQNKIGDRKLGHEYIYKAINIYETIGKCDKEIERCYYFIAGDYTLISEVNGLCDMKNKIKKLYDKVGSNQMLYDYYAVQAIYYSLLYQFQTPDKNNSMDLDSSISYFKKAISIMEKHYDELDDNVVPSWMYFNVAYLYTIKKNPFLSDSVSLYLDKAEKAKKGDYVDVEIELSINYLRIMKYYDDKKYELAEKEALKSVAILEKIKRNSLLPISCETYEILSKIYEQRGKMEQSLQYHKILLDVYKKQFNVEKTEALNDMNKEFETEKKENQIKFLEQKIAAERKMLIIIILLLISLAVSFGFILWNLKLHRKTLEQAVYESALLAELQREELKHLESVKERIKDNTAEIVAEQVKLLIDESIISKDKKTKYTENIADISLDIVEKIYLSSSEKLSLMDLKYIICFMIDMNVKDIGLLFNIFPDSVRKVHYRIRKKIGKNSLV